VRSENLLAAYVSGNLLCRHFESPCAHWPVVKHQNGAIRGSRDSCVVVCPVDFRDYTSLPAGKCLPAAATHCTGCADKLIDSGTCQSVLQAQHCILRDTRDYWLFKEGHAPCFGDGWHHLCYSTVIPANTALEYSIQQQNAYPDS
jgi:hypothetical protein